MVAPRTLRNNTHIAGLGLSDTDVRHIKQLMGIARKLREGFVYADKASITKTDILFVNADSNKVMDFYAKRRSDIYAIPVFVYNPKKGNGTYSPDLSQYPNAKTLTTPIKMTDLSNVLMEIVSSEKSSEQVEQKVAAPSSGAPAKATTASTPVSPAKVSKPAVKNKSIFKILVVDDSFPVRQYLNQKLPLLLADIDLNLEFDIQFAGSGREAVDKVKEARGAFDIVFLDIIMEDIDGYQICKWIKKVKSSINVVMLTSKSSPIDRVRANLSGCDNYLSKPPKDSHLKKVILKHRKFASTTAAS